MNPERPLPPERRPSALPASRVNLSEVAPEERRTLEQVWDLIGATAPLPPPPADEAWASLSARLDFDLNIEIDNIEIDTSAEQPAPKLPHRRATERRADVRRPAVRGPITRQRPIARQRPARRRWPALALGIAAVIALVLAWPRTVVHTAPLGKQHTVSLPDGSTVHLNSGAQLAHARGFARLPLVAAPTRTVRLRGEAFFDVADAATAGDRAFVVETFNAHVEVVGTQFNVQAWPSDAAPQTTVTVEEGIVLVAHRAKDTPAADAPDAVRLDAGSEAVVLPLSAAPIVHTDGAPVEQATAWRHDGLAFRGVPLTAVVAELERRYAVAIRLDASVDATAPFFYYQPSPGTLTTVLDDLGRGRGFQYRATSQGYVLFSE